MDDVFGELFPRAEGPHIIVMLHTFTGSRDIEIARTLRDIETLSDLGVSGAILENYGWGYGTNRDNRAIKMVEELLFEIVVRLRGVRFPVGVNVLPNDYWAAFRVADLAREATSGSFIQMDHVTGTFLNAAPVNPSEFRRVRGRYPRIAVFGGVHPKYYELTDPETRIEDSAKTARELAHAIVVTGERTGGAVSLDELGHVREAIGGCPLYVGSGLTSENARVQLAVADGAIVGTYLKRNSILSAHVDRERVIRLLDVVRDVRRMRKQEGR